jgi:hypothetical protein
MLSLWKQPVITLMDMRITKLSFVLFLLLINNVQAVTNTLPAELALPLNCAGERGFVVRTVQAPELQPNSFVRAVEQMTGTLTGADGTFVSNVAEAGTNADGSFHLDTINFERDGVPFYIWDAVLGAKQNFYPCHFPGVQLNPCDNFTLEAVAFLELPQGRHVMGFAVTMARTDVTDDDDFLLSASANPRDFLAAPIARFQRTGWFTTASEPVENLVTLEVPVTGIYPFRLLYWQTSWGANLQWYMLNPETRERIFINDPNDPRAIKAYRNVSNVRSLGPYVSEVNPWPGTGGNTPAAPIQVVLFDGQTQLDDASLRFFLNERRIQQSSLLRESNRVIAVWSPPTGSGAGQCNCRLEFAGSDGQRYTNAWNFSTSLASGTRVTGQWDFDRGDLSATVGLPLLYFDGPAGLTAQKTRFGTTSDFGLPDIAGQPAKVMQVPADLDRRIGYVMRHGIAPNGGGTRVNQYTLIFDILVASSGPWAGALLQINSTNNTDDGDLFWQQDNFGQGFGGYYGLEIFTAGEWHRVVAAYNLAASPPVVTKYVDGVFQYDWTENVSLDHPRRALLPTAILFADGDQDERRMLWVNSLQIREGAMSKAEIEALGGPSTQGIPLGNGIPNLTLTIRPAAGPGSSSVDIKFNTVYAETGKTFILEQTSSLSSPHWLPRLTTNATPDTVIFKDSVQEPVRYWRVRME